MKLKTFSLPAAALLTGAALGWALKPEASAPDAERAAKPAGAAGIAEADGAETRALQARIKELERALSEKKRKDGGVIEAKRTRENDSVREPGSGRRGRGERIREDIENLKKNDPQAYAEMTNRIATIRRRHAEHAKNKLDFLAGIDTSAMSPEARRVHERLQELSIRREELEEQAHTAKGISNEERMDIFRTLGETMRTIHELNLAERENLISQTIDSLGLKETDSQIVKENISAIIEATDFRAGMPPPGGRPRGDRRR